MLQEWGFLFSRYHLDKKCHETLLFDPGYEQPTLRTIANNSVFQAANLWTHTPQNVTSEYMDTFEALFGPQYQPNLSSDPDSVFSGWIVDQAMAFAYAKANAEDEGIGYVNLADLLTYPLRLFQDAIWETKLPSEYVVPVELSQMCVLPSIPAWAVLVYIAVVILIFIWCIGGLVIALAVDTSPETSSFDVVDFAAGVCANRMDGSLAETFSSLPFGKDAEIRKRLEDKSVYVRHIVGGRAESDGVEEISKIGFTTDGSKNLHFFHED
jgi:hypothetical protein